MTLTAVPLSIRCAIANPMPARQVPVNPARMNSHLDWRCASLLAVVLFLLGRPAHAAAEPAPPKLTLVVVQDGYAPTVPPSDAPPVLRDLVAIDLSGDPGLSMKSKRAHPFVAKVDETGAVIDVSFPTSGNPGPLAEAIRRSVLQWRFEPILRGGIARAVDIHLIGTLQPAPDPLQLEATGCTPPELVYAIRPTQPPGLRRRGLDSEIIPLGAFASRAAAAQPRVVGSTAGGRPMVQTTVGPFVNAPLVPLAFGPRTPLPWFPARIEITSVVDATGIPRAVAVRSSECPLLDPEAALTALARRYRPAVRDGVAVESRIHDELFFTAATVEGEGPEFIRAPRHRTSAETWDWAPTFARLTLPVFPTALARAKIEGRASAEVWIDAEGGITRVDIVKATRPEFGEAFRASLRDCAFTPASVAGTPIATRFGLEARFTLTPVALRFLDPQMPAFLMTYGDGPPPISGARLARAPRRLTGQPPARSAGGTVTQASSATLELIIDATGRVKDPEIIEASSPEFGYAAIQAVASWCFEPPQHDGKAVAARFRIPIKSQTPSQGDAANQD